MLSGCCMLLQSCLLSCLHASCLLHPFAYYASVHLHSKEGIANLGTGSLCRSARVLLVLVMLDRGGGQGGHGEQGQLHLGHSMAVQQALCPGKVCLQASYLLLTAPQPSLNCSLQQTQRSMKLRDCIQNAHVQGCMLASRCNTDGIDQVWHYTIAFLRTAHGQLIMVIRPV